MFTGLVETVGTVAAVSPYGGGRALSIRAPSIASELALGDSVAVDGVCLTVTARDAETFDVQAIATTLTRTTIGSFQPARRVNLERALQFGARLGGHLVQGHVDGLGRVDHIRRGGEHVLIDLALPAEVAAVTVLHGSITVNGVSLTVNALPAAGTAQVAIIPYTWDHTSISALRTGDDVNLEGDMIGKYVRHLLGAPGRGGGEDPAAGWGY